MSQLVVVAIPSKDDYVWKISSEDVPHMTLLYLGEADATPEMLSYLEHVINTNMCRFGMDVVRRGELGDQQADVLFFGKYGVQKLLDFRAYLLKNPDFSKRYEAAAQFPEFTPHLTLGFPDNPAKPDERDYPGISWVNFDKIAIWTGDSVGPEFVLDEQYDRALSMMDKGAEILEHHGVKGMKWGVRRDKGHEGQRAKTKKIAKLDRKFEQRTHTFGLTVDIHNGAARRANAKIHTINNKPKYQNIDFNKDSPIARAYFKEHKDLFIKSLHESAKDLGTNASGTKRYDIVDKGDHWDVVLVDVKHAASDSNVEFTVNLVKDEMGRIIKFEIANDVAQAANLGAEFLAHYGIKGMQWGVRRTPKQLSRARTKSSADHDKVAKLAKNKKHTLSNEELATVIKRKDLESRYSQMNPSRLKRGENVVKAVVGTVGTVSSVVALASSPAGKAAVTAAKAALKNAPKFIK